jgi:hypothetical protein
MSLPFWEVQYNMAPTAVRHLLVYETMNCCQDGVEKSASPLPPSSVDLCFVSSPTNAGADLVVEAMDWLDIYI